jgi:hypothetical protein
MTNWVKLVATSKNVTRMNDLFDRYIGKGSATDEIHSHVTPIPFYGEFLL